MQYSTRVLSVLRLNRTSSSCLEGRDQRRFYTPPVFNQSRYCLNINFDTNERASEILQNLEPLAEAQLLI